MSKEKIGLGHDDHIAAEVLNVPAVDWLTSTYLPFAVYSIRDRALISDDGLKPVQRRILYSLYKNGYTSSSEHLKAARAAADAVAFHPHGSSSVESAIARMAQGFSLRVPLIDPYGSVGTVTGDTAAAARYWEARLSKEAMGLVKELSSGAIPMGKNFDGKLDEPHTLPVRWPVNIINGTEGIAVGYASKMFPHNPDEVMDACRKVLKTPNVQLKTLLELMPGPDFPTGGELFEIDGVEEYYKTGKGGFTLRARFNVEPLTRGKMKIVFFELPYQVSAEQVMTRIQGLQQEKKFQEIATVKDLTDKKNGMRLVVETKSGSNHLSVIAELFKQTALEQKFSANNTVLVGNNPVTLSMIDLLRNFIEFRKQCVLNKAESRISKIDARLKQVDAILAALLDIDKAISIIRKANSAEEAQTQLMKHFKIDAEQADYILSMQLRRLTKADSVALSNEKKTLEEERKDMQEILSSEARLIKQVDLELVATKKIISNPRRTIISGLDATTFKENQKVVAQDARDTNKSLPCIVTRFSDGRVLKAGSFTYTVNDKKYGSSPMIEQIKMKTGDDIVLIGSDGLGRRIPMSFLTSDLTVTADKAGVQLPKGVRLVGISKSEAMTSDVGLAIVTKNGGVKIAKTDFPKSNEFPVVNLDAGDEVVDCRWIGKTLAKTHFAISSKKGNMLVFDATSVRAAGSKAGTTKGMNIKPGDEVISFDWIQNIKSPDAMVLSKADKSIKLTLMSDMPVKSKGGMGVALHGFKKDEKNLLQVFAGSKVCVGLEKTGTVVQLPPVNRRAGVGTELPFKVNFGVYEI